MSAFKGGWFIEVETLTGKWVKVAWSPKKKWLKAEAMSLNVVMLGDDIEWSGAWARLKKNKEK